MAYNIGFETKCYENDWEFLLKKGYLERMIENCNYSFSEKVLYINNVKNLTKVKNAADSHIKKGNIDRYHVVEEYAEKALQELGIEQESFRGGYYYSIAELVSVCLCQTEYLLHFASDSRVVNSKYNWIDAAIEQMNLNPEIIVANPTRNFRYDVEKEEAIKEDDDWFYSYNFSDQCYLIKTENFRDKIYNHYHPDSEIYPQYGGELFEKRVSSYMRNSGLWRITSKNISYKHKNFPKRKFRRFMRMHFASFVMRNKPHFNNWT